MRKERIDLTNSCLYTTKNRLVQILASMASLVSCHGTKMFLYLCLPYLRNLVERGGKLFKGEKGGHYSKEETM